VTADGTDPKVATPPYRVAVGQNAPAPGGGGNYGHTIVSRGLPFGPGAGRGKNTDRVSG
jgi:hypothetical protein